MIKQNKCFCGSDLSYKKCCRKATLQKKVKESILIQIHKDMANKAKECLFKDVTCSNIQRSHTVQRSNALKSICDDSMHIYTYKHVNCKGIVSDNSIKNPRKSSWKEASTFSALCNNHDSSLFNNIDTNEFKGSPIQVQQAALRSTLLVFHDKASNIESSSIIKKELMKGRNILEQQDICHKMDTHMYANSLGIKDFMKTSNKLLEFSENFNDNKFKESFSYLNIYFKGESPIFASGRHNPSFCVFSKEKIQNANDIDSIYESFSISSFKTEEGICFSFCWDKEFDNINKFFNDFLTSKNLGNDLISLLFNISENIFFSINWWDNELIEKQKKSLIEAFYNFSQLDDLKNYKLCNNIVNLKLIKIDKEY